MDIMLIFVFVISAFLGVELISKVPSQLHTPLMSGTNAISGITVVGAITVTAIGVGGKIGLILGFLAIVFATINVVGGYLVTDRMLGMFKKTLRMVKSNVRHNHKNSIHDFLYLFYQRNQTFRKSKFRPQRKSLFVDRNVDCLRYGS